MNYPFKTTPFDHQLDALEASWNKEEFALFMEMGTGKSKVLIDNMAVLYDKGKIESALIIAPKGVYRNWSDIEIPAHMPEHVVHKIYTWDASKSKKQLAHLEAALQVTDDLKILVMNVEAFSTKRGYDYAQKFLYMNPKTFMAIDESTVIKNHRAKRTKAIVKLRALAKYRRIATGSPVTKSPMDLYAQCYFLDPELLGSTSFLKFQNRYAITRRRSVGGHSFEEIIGYQNLEELTENLDKFSFRVLKEDCLDLPDKLYEKRLVPLTPEQNKVYKDMKDYAIAILDDDTEVSTMAVITQLMRLQQITCGFVKTDDEEVKEFKNNRIDELCSILNETSGKVIIWATWRYDINRLAETLRKKYGERAVATYYGDTSVEDRQDAVKRFQDPKSELQYFIGNPQTAGYGITLTEANTVVYYSNNYNLETRLQSEDRAHRIGQKNNVTYIDLVSPGTVDERIVKALMDKKSLADEIMGEQWREWLK